METYLSETIEIIRNKEKYDTSVKMVLADKQIIARILKYSLEEFSNYDISDIIKNMDEPVVSSVRVEPGMQYPRNKLIRDLIDIQYERNDTDFARGTFRVRGDVIEVIPAGENEKALRIEFFGDEIERIGMIESTSGHVLNTLEHVSVFPASHYATDQSHMAEYIEDIEKDLKIRAQEFEKENKLLEAQRITQRTRYDIEMMREIGYCQGIENYSIVVLVQYTAGHM